MTEDTLEMVLGGVGPNTFFNPCKQSNIFGWKGGGLALQGL